MNGPAAHYIDGSEDDRLHLQHGPIDLIIGVDASGPTAHARRRAAYLLAWKRFEAILPELVDELPLLKSPAVPGCPRPGASTARRMMEAVLPYAVDHFITPMAAVAGAVADEVLTAMLEGFSASDVPDRIHVNNGGDIALHLSPGASYTVGIAHETGAKLGRFVVHHDDDIRGIATSGRGGRSLSLGIADSVTVLSATAAQADAAATIIGNAVDLPDHPSIHRAPASSIIDDSDLGMLPAVVHVDALSAADIAEAIASGLQMADHLVETGRVAKVALCLQGTVRVTSSQFRHVHPPIRLETAYHA